MIRLRIINPEQLKLIETVEKDKDIPQATWYSRTKSYDWDMTMDDDIKNSPIGHNLECVDLDGIYLTTKNSIQDLIDFLLNAKESIR